MHSKPVNDEEDGTFTDWQQAVTLKGPWICVKCGGDQVYFRLWDSDNGAYQDIEYQCRSCGRHWWYEDDDG